MDLQPEPPHSSSPAAGPAPRRWVGDGPRRYLVTAMKLTRFFSSALSASLPLGILSTGAAGAGFLPQLRLNLPLKKKKKRQVWFWWVLAFCWFFFFS